MAINGDGAVAKTNGRQRLTIKSRSAPAAVTIAPTAPQRLAASMNGQQISVLPIGSGKPASLLAVDACCMGLIDHQERIVSVRNRDQVCKRSEVAVHAVQTFDHYPDAPCSAAGSPVTNRAFDRLEVVVLAYPDVGPAGSRAFMNACVHERIENKQVAPLWQGCQDGKICDVTAAEEERCFRPEELSGLCFETFVFLTIAAQKPRPAAPIGVPAWRACKTAFFMRGASASAR